MTGPLKLEITTRGIVPVETAAPEVFNAFDEAMIEELDSMFARLAAEWNLGSRPPIRTTPWTRYWTKSCRMGRHTTAWISTE